MTGQLQARARKIAQPGQLGTAAIPQGVFAFESADFRIDNRTHLFEVEHHDDIAAHWQREVAANPRLYDNPTVHFASLALEDGLLAGRFHMVRYSTFLFWRRQHGRRLAEHVYAHPVIVTADGLLVAGRMAGGTINTGLVYCPAGSFDDSDIVDGRLDVDGNMAREVREETGLELGTMRAEATMHGFEASNGVVVMRRYFSGLDSLELGGRVRAHIAADPQAELTEPVFLSAGSYDREDLSPQMPPIIRWHFGG